MNRQKSCLRYGGNLKENARICRQKPTISSEEQPNNILTEKESNNIVTEEALGLVESDNNTEIEEIAHETSNILKENGKEVEVKEPKKAVKRNV